MNVKKTIKTIMLSILIFVASPIIFTNCIYEYDESQEKYCFEYYIIKKKTFNSYVIQRKIDTTYYGIIHLDKHFKKGDIIYIAHINKNHFTHIK